MNMQYDKNNIFAKIITGEIPCKKVYEDEDILAFHDIAPEAQIHVLVIPKEMKYKSYNDFVINANPSLLCKFFTTVQKIAQELNLEKDGYRLTTNHGENAMQSVHHFHMHILAGQKLGKMTNTHT